MEKSSFIDATTDYGFKRIFGTEANKDLLLSFLNELFQGRKNILELHYNKNEHVGDTEGIGGAIFDLTCTDDKGRKFIVEVQRATQANFNKRMVFYGNKLIADQAPRGNRRDWNYDISEVYVVVVMDGFHMPEGKSSKKYLHRICLCDQEDFKPFYQGLEFVFVELINFEKQERELEGDLEGWLYVLKNMSSLDRIPLYFRKPIFEKLFDIAQYSKLSTVEKELYDSSLKKKWDNRAILDGAKEEGREVGR